MIPELVSTETDTMDTCTVMSRSWRRGNRPRRTAPNLMPSHPPRPSTCSTRMARAWSMCASSRSPCERSASMSRSPRYARATGEQWLLVLWDASRDRPGQAEWSCQGCLWLLLGSPSLLRECLDRPIATLSSRWLIPHPHRWRLEYCTHEHALERRNPAGLGPVQLALTLSPGPPSRTGTRADGGYG